MKPIIEVRDVKTIFDDRVIHDGLNLTISEGEIYGLLGPSGCGKSTTLRMIAGLEEITGGEILIGNKVVNDLPPKDRDIAMVFQNYALYPHMNVYNNMAFGLTLKKFEKTEIVISSFPVPGTRESKINTHDRIRQLPVINTHV